MIGDRQAERQARKQKMILKIWDDKEEQEGWIWFDHVKAVKRLSGQRYCVATARIESADSDMIGTKAQIYLIKDHESIDREAPCSFDDNASPFGSWMFSGMREVEGFENDDQYTEIKFLDVVYESSEEQRLIFRKDHPSCYLLSDTGKTIERI